MAGMKYKATYCQTLISTMEKLMRMHVGFLFFPPSLASYSNLNAVSFSGSVTMANVAALPGSPLVTSFNLIFAFGLLHVHREC